MQAGRALVACALAFAVTLSVCFALPLRAKGADTLPGRLGAVTLACMGSYDLGNVEWVRREALRSGAPYWLTVTGDGEHLVSTWGPVPAWVGSFTLGSLEKGSVVSERELMRLVRHASACALGLSAAIFCLALLRWMSPARAVLWSLAMALSFAGAGTLGQALWQQTVALPLLVAVLASLAWEEEQWPLVVTPALLAALVLTRPPEIALALPLAALWLLRVRGRLPLAGVALALGLAVAASLPIVAWNLRYFDAPLAAGQWAKNELASPGEILLALLGLLVSPGRGALWYAPVLVVAFALGGMKVWRAGAIAASDLLLCGVVAQTALVACFVMWWGGYVSFGPRLLALPLWAGVAWLAESGVGGSLRRSRVVEAALAITAVVGLAGGALFDPGKWDHSNDTRRLWQVVDSPLPALWRAPRSVFSDSLERGPFVYCANGSALAPLPAGAHPLPP